MPTLPPVPQVLKLVVGGHLAGDPWANVLHWLYDGGPPLNADVDHFCNTLYTSFAAELGGYMHTEWSLGSVLGEDLASGSGAVGGHVATTNGSSGSTGIPAVQNNILIHHQIARRYRGGHPRSYLCGLPSNLLLTARQWQSSFVGNITTAWNNIQATMDADTSGGVSLLGQVSVSYFDKALVPAPPHLRVTPVVDLILGSTAEAIVATQRRRVGR